MVTDFIIQRMLENEIILKEEEESYRYILEIRIQQIVASVVILILSVLFHATIPTLIFLVCFFQLKKSSGGFHVNSSRKCLVLTVIIYIVLCTAIFPVLYREKILIGTFLFSETVIFLIGAVNHPNMDWSKRELEEAKKTTRLTAFVEGFIFTGAYIAGLEKTCAAYMVMGIALDAILICLAKIVHQEV